MENAWAALSRLEADAEADVAALVASYQMRPHLLDAVIPQALRLLTTAYVATHSNAPLHSIYVFSRVRGHKTVMQHLPTDAMLLDMLVSRLTDLRDPAAGAPAGPPDWQAEYALLLWLGVLVLTPFELENLGPGLWHRVYTVGSGFLSQSGIQRDAAAVLIARLLTRSRSDQDRLVDAFVDGCPAQIQLGQLQVLAEVMDRTTSVPPSIRGLVQRAMQGSEDDKDALYYDSMLHARLWVKIMGRVALREIDAAEFVEYAVAECFALLDNKSTRVRMTAAKYIARLAAKLPDEYAEEVCGELISSLDEDVSVASPDYYNGALIALAEVVRRKLIRSPQIFEDLVAKVLEVRGLHFLQERLTTQVGTSVRDAACYVCWSLFRSVPGLDPVLRTRLFDSLIALALLDHEVNVRRAAAAALQEGLGRYGQQLDAEYSFFIMENINFQSVSLVSNCYLELAPQFSDRPGFLHYFSEHGVLNASADIRRLAAKAAPALASQRAPITDMIDALFELYHRHHSQTFGAPAHGIMLALASLYATESDHRREEARMLIHPPGESDLHTEAVLRLLPVAPDQAARILSEIIANDKYVMEAAADMCTKLPHETLYGEVLPVCVRRMEHNIMYVACIVAMPDVAMNVIIAAARLPDPQSRALAVSRLNLSTEDARAQLIAALNDYSVDDRGDVGGWVREAALERVVALGSATKELTEIVEAVWRMASDSRQKLRALAGQALVTLGVVKRLEFESAEQYYFSLLCECPSSARQTVARGVAASIGAFHSNMTTVEGAFAGLVRYLDTTAEAEWVIKNIMGIERTSVQSCTEVVRTLHRLVIHGVAVEPWTRALAIAFNTTLAPRVPEAVVISAVDLLSVYADRSTKASERLERLVKTHGNGKVRQRAADALFASGVENDVLETTDWTRGDFAEHARQLKINT